VNKAVSYMKMKSFILLLFFAISLIIMLCYYKTQKKIALLEERLVTYHNLMISALKDELAPKEYVVFVSHLYKADINDIDASKVKDGFDKFVNKSAFANTYKNIDTVFDRNDFDIDMNNNTATVAIRNLSITEFWILDNGNWYLDLSKSKFGIKELEPIVK